MECHTFEWGTSQKCWEKLNEFFITQENQIREWGGLVNRSQVLGYNFLVFARKAWVDPEFDFTKHFNYRIQKWTSLVNNYIDFNHLDIVVADVRSREMKKDKQYNVSYVFNNSHGSGKGCLLSLTFSRRANFVDPVLIVNLRSSEIVKRLILDYLLIQRIGEYAYGEKTNFGIQIFFPNLYTTAEVSAMYNVHRRVDKIIGKAENVGPFGEKVLQKVKELENIDMTKINYKIHLRAARVLQQSEDQSNPIIAKNLKLKAR